MPIAIITVLLTLASLFAPAAAPPPPPQQQQQTQRFITVDGESLRSRMETAKSMARSAADSLLDCVRLRRAPGRGR